MDQKEKIVLELTISDKEATKRIADNNKQVKALQEENKKLAKSYEQNAEAIAANQEKIKSLNRESAVYSGFVQQNTKYNKANTGSIVEMRAKLSLLNQEYIQLSQEQRENAAVGGKLRDEIKGLSDELKGLEKGIGNTSRNVGNYTDSIVEAFDKSKIFGDTFSKVKTILDGGKEAFAKAKQEIIIVKSSLFGANAGAITFAGGLKLVKTALAATGIGLFVLALGAVVSFLTRTQEGIDFVDRKLKGFNTVLAVITDQLSAFGKKLFDAFDNPKQAIIDLVDFIGTNLLNRLKSFGVILDGIVNRDFTKIQDGITQFATGITDATKKSQAWTKELIRVAKTAEEIERVNQQLRDAERDLNVERARSREEIKRLNLIVEDTSKSNLVRAEAARKSGEIELGLINKLQALQQRKIDNIKAEQALTNNLTADNEKLAEAEQELANISAESLEIRTTINNKLNTILQAQAALQKESNKAALEARLIYAEKGSQEELDLRVQLIEKAAALELENAQLTANQRALIVAKAEEEIFKIRKDYFLKGLELRAIDAQEAERQRLEELKRKDKEYSDLLLKETAWIGQSIAQQVEKGRQENENAEKDKQDRIQIEQAKYDTIFAITDSLSTLSGLLAKNSAQAADFQKAIALFQITVDTAKAISAATASGPLGILTIAATVGTVLANIAKAKQLLSGDTPEPPAFQRTSRAAGTS